MKQVFKILKSRFKIFLGLGLVLLGLLFYGPLNFSPGGLARPRVKLFSAPNFLALKQASPPFTLGPNFSLANFFARPPQTIVWHGKDQHHSYHLMLQFTPQNGQALWQVIHKSSGKILAQVSRKITLADWRHWPQQDLKIESQHFSFPQVDADGLFITTQIHHHSTPHPLKLYWQLKVLNYNVQNLWDHDPYNTDPRIMVRYELFQKAKSNWYEPHIQNKVAQNLAQVLAAQGLPDMVALQEIESAHNQSKIFAPSSAIYQALRKLGYQSFLLGPQETEHPVAITTAIISRYPLQAFPSLILNASTLSDLPSRLRRSFGRKARDMQVAVLDLGFTRTALVVVHWPALFKMEDLADRDIIYLAHQKALNRFLACTNAPQASANFPECWVKEGNGKEKENQKGKEKGKEVKDKPAIILLGDFNLSLGDPALPPRPWLDLWYTLPLPDRWESVFQGKPATLSHIILEESFLRDNYLQFIPHHFQVGRGFLLQPDHTPLKRQWLKTKSHGQNYYNFSGEGYADHLPLQAEFRVWPIKPSPLHAQWQTTTPIPSSTSSFSSSSSSSASSLPCPPLRGSDLMAAKIGQCFTVDFSLRPQRLKSNGVYRHNFVLLDGQKLYLILAPAWQTLSSDFPYAKVLNFNRQVFQKKGGRLVQARGKLGYWLDGYGLFIAQRQDLRLDHLSRRKALNYVQLK